MGLLYRTHDTLREKGKISCNNGGKRQKKRRQPRIEQWFMLNIINNINNNKKVIHLKSDPFDS